MPVWPFTPTRAGTDAARLLATVEAASRRPAFFGPGRVADTLEGRFELLALNVSLALLRVRAEPAAEPLAQSFTDRFFRSIDAGLRESGVGDLSVPKKMRALGSAFYGRLNAYAEPLAARDQAALTAAIARNILQPEAAPFAAAIAAFAQAAAQAQAAAALDRLFSPEGWPDLGG